MQTASAPLSFASACRKGAQGIAVRRRRRGRRYLACRREKVTKKKRKREKERKKRKETKEKGNFPPLLFVEKAFGVSFRGRQ